MQGSVRAPLCWLVAAAVCAAAGGARVRRVVGGEPADPPPPDDPSVWVPTGPVPAADAGASGPSVLAGPGLWVNGVREKSYYAFLGLRYALPPVGRLRFQRPRRSVLSGTGELDASKPPPPCPQPSPAGNGTVGSEDCLFLNIFTPQLPWDEDDLLPVLVWIHGGGWRRGSAHQYGVSPLLSQRLVVVTVQYRLGSLGFLSASTPELPGNAGLFDLTAALAWVRRHIRPFGGDPGRVTAFGQGSGAASALMLGLSKLSRGFLGGVLAMSGSVLSAFALDRDPLGTARDIAARAGCPLSPALALVRCLQEVPAHKLVEADSGLEGLRLRTQGLLAGLAGLLGAAPVVEGGEDGRGLPHFLTAEPAELLQGPGAPAIPLLTGVTSHETATAVLGHYRQEIERGIAEVPGYIDTLMGGLIRVTAPLLGNLSAGLLQPLATNYFSLLPAQGTDLTLNRLVEASGDALFFLPALQTARRWAQKAPLFLYVLQHGGGGGPAFLQGLPLVQGSGANASAAAAVPQPEAGPGHGDDLPLLFEPRPLSPEDGSEPLLTVSDPGDRQTQQQMTQFVAQFARSGPAPSAGQLGQPPGAPRFGERRGLDLDEPCQMMQLWSGGLQGALCRGLGTALGRAGAGLSSAAAAGTVLAEGSAPAPAPALPALPSLPVRNVLG